MYLFMALFWLVIGVLIQLFWTRLQPLAFIPVDRTVMAFICFIMFSWSFVRWRMMGSVQRPREEPPERTYPRRRDEPINPDFDFSDPKPDDPSIKEGPPPA